MNFSIQLHLSHHCNLRCKHCYQESQNPGNSPAAADYRQVEQFIMATCRDFIPVYEQVEFNLTGGEPLLYPALWQVVQTIKDHGATFNLLSNGTLIDDDVIAKLRQYKIKNLQVSLEGLEQYNDAIRGANVFSKVITVLDKLVKNNIKVTVALTVTRRNYKHINKFLDYFSRLDVGIGFQRYIPVANNDKEQLAITDSKTWETIIKGIVDYKNSKNRRIVMNDPLFGLELLKAHEKKKGKKLSIKRYFGCSIGISAVTVMPGGTIFPCRKLPVPIGNAFETPLMKTWLNSSLLWQLRERKNLQGKCGQCANVSKCGGCRAFAYWKSEVIINEDPVCFN
jgi:radical SAM protein with 4Fe4S-binding SPASM domain